MKMRMRTTTLMRMTAKKPKMMKMMARTLRYGH